MTFAPVANVVEVDGAHAARLDLEVVAARLEVRRGVTSPSAALGFVVLRVEQVPVVGLGAAPVDGDAA